MNTSFVVEYKNKEGLIMANELLDLVDNNDNVIGVVDRKKVYDEMIHYVRVIGAFIVDEDGLILVQRRAANRRYCPNGYDFSVAGHVLSGENYEEAMHREAIEELGIDIDEFEEFLYCRYPNDYGLTFFSKYYIGKCPKKDLIQLNLAESSRIEFMSVDEIKKKLEKSPKMFKSDYGPTFAEYCKYVGKL